jgi:hypothetical protein
MIITEFVLADAERQSFTAHSSVFVSRKLINYQTLNLYHIRSHVVLGNSSDTAMSVKFLSAFLLITSSLLSNGWRGQFPWG